MIDQTRWMVLHASAANPADPTGVTTTATKAERGLERQRQAQREDEKLEPRATGLCACYGSAAARSDDTDTLAAAGQPHRTNSEQATDPSLAEWPGPGEDRVLAIIISSSPSRLHSTRH
jgi:hypothetical protein